MGSKQVLFNRMASTAMAMVAYGQTYTPPAQHENTISKGEAKKCKSCANYPCPKSKKPMQIACNGYERKKKKK